MSGSFGIVRVAASGMYTSQAALNVTSGNISNAGVSTYTRQAAIVADASTAVNVGGADLTAVAQIRDSYLDASYRKESGLSGYWEYLSGIATQLDALAGYDSDTGLPAVAEEFFNAWEEAGKNPEDTSVRSAVIEAGTTLAESLTAVSAGLDTIRQQVAGDLADAVEAVNSLGATVAELGNQIRRAEAAGKDAAVLEDQLNSALDELSAYGNVTVRQGTLGTAVYFGNQLLVDRNTVRTLQLEQNAEGVTGVSWAATGYGVSLTSGSMQAQLELLAPAADTVSFGTETEGLLAAYGTALEAYAAGLAEGVNTLHAAAYDLAGSTGTAFFTAADTDTSLSAGNIRINAVLDDTDCLACSAGGQSGDGDNAAAISALLDEELLTTASGETVTASGFQSALAEWTGFIGETAAANEETQAAVIEQITTERTAVTGVSLDEELTRMIAYQQAYNANAQILSIISELLGTVINDMKR